MLIKFFFKKKSNREKFPTWNLILMNSPRGILASLRSVDISKWRNKDSHCSKKIFI